MIMPCRPVVSTGSGAEPVRDVPVITALFPVVLPALLAAQQRPARPMGGASGGVAPVAATAPAPPSAQAKAQQGAPAGPPRADGVPREFEPPPGMCRVWVDGVPAERQPAPTDCVTAVRNRPNNGRVVFGPDADASLARARRRLSGEELEARVEQGPRRDARRVPGVDDEFLQRLQAGDICIDRNHDGRCDDVATGSDGCLDANRDGRCDDARYDLNYIFGGAQGGPPIPPGAQVRSAYGGAPPGDGFRMGSALGAGVVGPPGVPPGVPGAPAGLGTAFCFDRNHDGRCDEPWGDASSYPQTLPEMDAAARLRRGESSYDIQRWLRRTDLIPRIVRARSGGPGGPIERITWTDQVGELVQIWTDRDLDGIADRVEIFQGGRRIQLIER